MLECEHSNYHGPNKPAHDGHTGACHDLSNDSPGGSCASAHCIDPTGRDNLDTARVDDNNLFLVKEGKVP